MNPMARYEDCRMRGVLALAIAACAIAVAALLCMAAPAGQAYAEEYDGPADGGIVSIEVVDAATEECIPGATVTLAPSDGKDAGASWLTWEQGYRVHHVRLHAGTYGISAKLPAGYVGTVGSGTFEVQLYSSGGHASASIADVSGTDVENHNGRVRVKAAVTQAPAIKEPCTITFDTGVAGLTVDPIVVEKGTKVSSESSEYAKYLPGPKSGGVSDIRMFLFWSKTPARQRATIGEGGSYEPNDYRDEVHDFVVESDVTFYAAYYNKSKGTDGTGVDHRKDADGNLIWWYEPNGGQGQMTDTVVDEMRTTVKGCEFARPGYKFVRWNNFPDGTGASYTAGSRYFTSSWSQPLYAMWEPLGASKQFSDLSSAEWYHQVPGGAFPGTTELFIDYAADKGLMSGYNGTSKFGPNDGLTRGMAATIIYRMATGKTAATTVNTVSTKFSDVPSGEWYTAAVKWASENGVITGYKDEKTGQYTTFGPNDLVTREQLTAMIARYCENVEGMASAGDDVKAFKDASQMSPWAKEGVAFCAAHGIVSGIGDTGNFEPGGSATRAQMAKIIAVTDRMEKKPASGGDLAAQAFI